MKCIEKQAPPTEWVEHNKPEAWVDQDGNPMNWTYEKDVPHKLKVVLKQSLISEQGGICGYTGLRILIDNSHVEHIKPQNQCVNHEDVDYNNLIAAYPEGGNCEFGAIAKGGWYEAAKFISPLQKECEVAFLYFSNGEVQGQQGNLAAEKTIEVLNLKCSELRRIRKDVIDSIFEIQLTKDDVVKYINALDKRDSDGLFLPFCFVLRYVLQSYLI
jgi:uncharacterized protein (TIGR02646 family)